MSRGSLVCCLVWLLFQTSVLFGQAIPKQFDHLPSDSTDYSAEFVSLPKPSVDRPSGPVAPWGSTIEALEPPRQCDNRNCDDLGFFPTYSKVEAWNADSSELILQDRKGSYHLYNAASRRWMHRFTNDELLHDSYDRTVRWSHTEPNVIFFRWGMKMFTIDTKSFKPILLHTFRCDEHTDCTAIQNGEEGNSSADDRLWVWWTEDRVRTQHEIIVYDRVLDKVIAQKTISDLCGGCQASKSAKPFNWVGMSPSGKFVLIQWNRHFTSDRSWCEAVSGDPKCQNLGSHHGAGTEVYDSNLRYLGLAGSDINHGDVGYDVNGKEVWVSTWNFVTQASYYRLSIKRLDSVKPFPTPPDAIVSLPRSFVYSDVPSKGSAWQPANHFHLSMQCTRGPAMGWALFSTYTTGQTTGRGWGASELIALRIDSTEAASSTWARIGRTFSIRDQNYSAEPHGVPNLDFTKVLWGSDWMVDGGRVQAFTINLQSSTNDGLPPSPRPRVEPK